MQPENIKPKKGLSHKAAFSISGIFVVIAVVGVLGNKFLASSVPPTLSTASSTSELASVEATSSLPTKLLIGTTTISLDIANTDATRFQGLSGKPSLSDHEAMLFIFDTPGQYGFWMKDMKFNLDIIWLDKNFTVVTLKQNLSPKTYPTSFTPSSPALYVLEANAGFAKTYGIKVGSKLDIQN